ncbi:MAG: hypothetical protein HYY41_03265 [Chloroflexi bacterium]|nr:hypothetical protein [Chloroflexota bacterium]MBI2979830.1 hypothetical protein [Chloroflexota bacterium]
MTDNHLSLEEEANQLARKLFGNDRQKCLVFTRRLLDIYTTAQDNDFLLIHNPGGWGNTRLEHCLQWERSIVEGISNTLRKRGYTGALIQHFRTGTGLREIMRDIREQARFFTSKAEILAAELKFITGHLNSLKVILIGASQGAAFSNAVLQRVNNLEPVHSIELGTPFFYKSRRVITKKTLAIDSNGLMPDAMMEWDVLTILKAFAAAPFRWIKYRLQGTPIRFSYCINVPGHEYNWEYPEVQQHIEDFLGLNFITKSVEVESR